MLRILSLVSAGTPWRVRVCSCAARANLIRLGGSFRTGVGLACVIDFLGLAGIGRGDTAPYSVDREIEDIDALIAEAGGSSAVFGYSSGANLALKAAAGGLAITKLVLYEPPFLVDESRPRPPADLPDQLAELISAGRRGDAVELFA